MPHALITPPSAAARLDRTTGWLRRRPPSERTPVVAASVDAASAPGRLFKRRDLDQRRRLEPLRRLA